MAGYIHHSVGQGGTGENAGGRDRDDRPGAPGLVAVWCDAGDAGLFVSRKFIELAEKLLDEEKL